MKAPRLSETPLIISTDIADVVLLTLSMAGRSTGLDVARLSGLSCRDVIAALTSLAREGRVIQLNGFWALSEGKTQTKLTDGKRPRVCRRPAK